MPLCHLSLGAAHEGDTTFCTSIPHREYRAEPCRHVHHTHQNGQQTRHNSLANSLPPTTSTNDLPQHLQRRGEPTGTVIHSSFGGEWRGRRIGRGIRDGRGRRYGGNSSIASCRYRPCPAPHARAILVAPVDQAPQHIHRCRRRHDGLRDDALGAFLLRSQHFPASRARQHNPPSCVAA